MDSNRPLKVPDVVWYGETPYSPETPSQAGLVFRAAPGVSESGPTVALAAAYRLGSALTESYGGQLPRAVWVVAVNEETGRVHQADLNGPDHPPIRVTAPDPKADSAAPDGSSESGRFNVDLCAVLGLPEEAGRYAVFLWLDDLVSATETVLVPANSARGKGRPTTSQPARLVQFLPDPTPPRAGPGEIVLTASGKPGDASVHGAWVPGKAADPKKVVLWLLVVSHRERRFAWVAIRAHELPTNATSYSFSFDPMELLKTSGVAQKVFVLGFSADGSSKVLVVRPR